MDLKEQIIEVLEYSQNCKIKNIDKIYDIWEKAKDPFVKMFGGNLIYEYPKKVTFKLTQETKSSRYNAFIDEMADLLYDGESTIYSDFIDFLQKLSIEEFYSNKINSTYQINEDKKIPKGTKVLKAFKFFIEEKELLMEIQNRASMLIQEDKVEGTLCLSVHPLDFLSSSENTYNWRSCHSLDGEYRQGNLSYMLDCSTIICYLKSDKDTILPNFPESVPWNNKKWRCLLFMDTERVAIFAGRQYPFFTPGSLDLIREIILDLSPEERDWLGYTYNIEWSHWHNDYIESFSYKENDDTDHGYLEEGKIAVIRNKVYDIRNIIQDIDGSAHFNDLLNSSVYIHPYYMWKKNGCGLPKDISFYIGHVAPCLICGKDVYDKTDDSMLCIDCECQFGNADSEDFDYCNRCGQRFFHWDGEWVDDDYICPTCKENETFICESCGERVYNEDKVFSEKLKTFICKDCLSIIEEMEENDNG